MSPRRRLTIAALLCLAILPAVGCQTTDVPDSADVVANPEPAPEKPAANLPEQMRPHNWTDSGGSGSCVHASTVYSLRWRGEEELADWWKENHAGGETATSIRRYHDSANLKYAYTESADESFLQWATRTRRAAIIWFFPSHCVTFCGFGKEDGTEYAYLNDNNRPSRFLKIEKTEFLRRWKGYGGFALALLKSPVPPPLYPAFRRPTDA